MRFGSPGPQSPDDRQFIVAKSNNCFSLAMRAPTNTFHLTPPGPYNLLDDSEGDQAKSGSRVNLGI